MRWAQVNHRYNLQCDTLDQVPLVGNTLIAILDIQTGHGGREQGTPKTEIQIQFGTGQ